MNTIYQNRQKRDEDKESQNYSNDYYRDLWSFDLYVIVKRDRSNNQSFWSFHKRFYVLGYKLVGFISHMGTSTMVGHYVCHLLKEDRWVIFNDEKVRILDELLVLFWWDYHFWKLCFYSYTNLSLQVALSENPPKELGYIYMYQRID